MYRVLITVLILLALRTPAGAAQAAAAGSIGGVVRDTASRPVAGAEVVLHPGNQRSRTDSAGRFMFASLGPNSYTLRARKLGYAPTDFDVKLTTSAHTDIQIVFDRPLPLLDTVVVAAGRTCSPASVDGFACRRRAGGGLFLDYIEIDDKEPLYTADIFRDIKGFNTGMNSTRQGAVRTVERWPPWGCITSLVNGRPASGAIVIPQYASDIMAIEIYTSSDSVPLEYRRYASLMTGTPRSGRCYLVVYWTIWARTAP